MTPEETAAIVVFGLFVLAVIIKTVTDKTAGAQPLTRHFQSRTLWLAIPVLFCEVAIFGNVHAMYLYFEHWLQAILLALSFSVLLIGSVVMAARDIPKLIRGLLIAGGLCLFVVQGISTISGVFLNAIELLPAVQLSLLWGGTPPQITVRFSVIYGLIINIVCAIYYVALSLFLRIEEQRKEERKASLQQLEELMR